jgi:ATPase family associated with various cellular activities (AAA)
MAPQTASALELLINDYGEQLQHMLRGHAWSDAMPPLRRLRDALQLSPLEVAAVLICLAPTILPHWREYCMALQREGRSEVITFETIATILELKANEQPVLRKALGMDGVLLRAGILVRPAETRAEFYDLRQAPFFIASRIVNCLLDLPEIDPARGEDLCFEVRAAEWTQYSSEAQHVLLLRALRESVRDEAVLIHGGDEAERLARARQVAGELERNLLILRPEPGVATGTQTLQRRLETIQFETRILNAVLYIPHEVVDANAAGLISALLKQKGVPITLMEAATVEVVRQIRAQLAPDRAARAFESYLPTPEIAVRSGAWLQAIEYERGAENLADDLGRRYRFTLRQIEDATTHAKNCAALRPDGVLAAEDLQTGARIVGNRRLMGLAERIETRQGWERLFLPETQLDQLRALVSVYRQRERFYGELGYGEIFHYGQGVTALFNGASGTGKTLAAGIVAYALGLDIFKIDLSRVVSKYIGDTEKNLALIFEEATLSNAVLFFDEADALFGKRSEVKDAHDRYANIEVAYLLQKMEDYAGLTILATNFGQNIDDAFRRRIQFVVPFPKPQPAERLAMWRSFLGERIALAPDFDWELLADQVELSGGGIANVVKIACMSALDEEAPVSMTHILRAVKAEYLKENQLFMAANFGKFSSRI